MCTNHVRAIKNINEKIKELKVDLSGLIVLTEVGSHNYLYTPLIPALAGAEHVYAWTADSPYGNGDEIKEQCLMLAEELNLQNKITISVNCKNLDDIKNANIITNSGFLRPLNQDFLNCIKPENCVISLMFEAWELREQDIDIDYCIKKGIRVAGTWENHASIGVFDAVGSLSIKLAMEAGYEVYQNNILIWSNDEFGEVAESAFEKFGAKNIVKTIDEKVFYEVVSNIDFVYFCNYKETRKILGQNAFFDIDRIIDINPAIGFVHLFGDIDAEYIEKKGVQVYPEKKGKVSVMTETLAYLGSTPIINLLVAGFKVGEAQYKKEKHSLVQPISGIES